MNTSEVTSYLTQHVGSAYGLGRTWIVENRRLAAVGVAAALSITLIGVIYRRLQRADVLPFDTWYVSLGLTSFPQIPTDRLADLIANNSPAALASWLYSHWQHAKKSEDGPAHPVTTQEWLTVNFNNRDALLRLISTIFPVYREKHLVSPDAAQTMAVQTWATTLQQWGAFLGWNTLSMTEGIFQSVRSSPRIAYTILFHFTAPFVAQKIWENIQPESFEVITKYCQDHRISIAAGSLAVVGFLFYRMKQEKGILKNLTHMWATFQKGHRRYDQASSYRKGIQEVLSTLGKTEPGKRGSNIIWYFQSQAHKTFGKEIGDALAEVTAAGRIYDDVVTAEKYPRLKNLQVFEINLKEFLTQHRDEESVYHGWNEIMSHIAAAGNVVVVLKGSSLLGPTMFPERHSSQHNEPHMPERSKDPAQLLADLVTLSLEQGRFQCLMVLDESEKKRLKPDYSSLFTVIKAPDLTPAEQEAVCLNLYSTPGIVQSLPAADIRSLFKLMKPVLKVATLPPAQILDAVQDGQWTWEQSWRHQGDSARIQKIQEAENRLQEVLTFKEQLLQKIWEQRKAGLEEPLSLLQALVMVEKLLLPLYIQAVTDLKKDLPSAKQPLINSAQKQFNRFFGTCTPEEEARLLELPDVLRQKIKGQNRAIRAVGEAVYRWRKVPPRDGKPLVLFFSGPPAAGKTQTTTALAYHMNSVYGISESAGHNHESNIKRINLNREKQGAFLGWDIVKIQILEFIFENPTSIIVFEEWDKMPDNEKSCLLELLEGTQCYIEGVYTANRDRPFVERRCAIIVITSNGASKALAQPEEGDDPAAFELDRETVRKEIIASFPEEKKIDGEALVSRIDSIVPFRGISQQGQNSLTDDYLAEYQDQEVFTEAQVVEIRKKIAADIKDGRKLQQAVQDAIFEVVRKR